MVNWDLAACRGDRSCFRKAWRNTARVPRDRRARHDRDVAAPGVGRGHAAHRARPAAPPAAAALGALAALAALGVSRDPPDRCARAADAGGRAMTEPRLAS